LIGPFTGRQLLTGAIVILVTAVVLVVVTTPLGTSAFIPVRSHPSSRSGKATGPSWA
jgi:hypothetical protein